MATAPFHNRSHFERAIGQLIQRATAQNRAEDLHRIVTHLDNRPRELSKLASLMLMLDEDYRTELKEHVAAYQRFAAQKGVTYTDDDIFEVLWAVYEGSK